ncbi:MAG: hypothetical protein Q8N26_30680 [Myxococcales bacterium]|nr:hypothetical protein [Myxococcales bacterium]
MIQLLRWMLPVVLFAQLAVAQTAESPPSAPPDAVTAPPPPPAEPEATTPTPPGPKASDRVTKGGRFSRFSAGPGGALFAFSEAVDGLILGALAGTGIGGGGSGGAFIGALLGGVVLGGAATALQYAHPIGVATAGTIALGLGVGALAGFGLSTALVVSQFSISSLIALAGSQIGMLVPLIALWSTEDISGEDLALMGMTSTYAFVITALASLLFTGIDPNARVSAILFAPAFGMALGSLWALGPDLVAGRILKLTALPLGVGALTLMLGLLLASNNLQIVSAATLITTIGTFGITYFLTADDPDAPVPPAVAVQPTITMMPSGWRNEAVAVGPALVGRF